MKGKAPCRLDAEAFEACHYRCQGCGSWQKRFKSIVTCPKCGHQSDFRVKKPSKPYSKKPLNLSQQRRRWILDNFAKGEIIVSYRLADSKPEMGRRTSWNYTLRLMMADGEVEHVFTLGGKMAGWRKLI